MPIEQYDFRVLNRHWWKKVATIPKSPDDTNEGGDAGAMTKSTVGIRYEQLKGGSTDSGEMPCSDRRSVLDESDLSALDA
ncbi:hypothetical protein KIN20_031758 [Parelaphostrongylus tenuis]|uniref:Uncharacterized protein n=1 Tax=Parelaphostrongylus tenuis TaxID=148309 RepID=A0AAD5R632_PARTN|nr:hypothetical protein KIN20_031758 [Parelaphostrongylus tenuis]